MTTIARPRIRLGRGLLTACLTMLACAPTPRWVAVAGDSSQTLLLYDGNLTAADTVPWLEGEAAARTVTRLTASSDGTSLYATLGLPDGDALVRFRRNGGSMLHRLPVPAAEQQTITLLPRQRILLLTTRTPGSTTDTVLGKLWFVSSTNVRRLQVLEVCATDVLGTTVMKDGDRAYVTCGDGHIAEIDLRLRRTVRTVPIGGDDRRAASACDAGAAALSENGTILLVPCTGTGRIIYLDRVTLTPLDSLPVGRGVRRLLVGRAGRALALLPSASAAAVVDLRRHRVITEISTDFAPTDAILSADGRHGYVLATDGSGPGAVHRIDLETGAITGTAVVGHLARVIALWPGPHTPVMRWVH